MTEYSFNLMILLNEYPAFAKLFVNLTSVDAEWINEGPTGGRLCICGDARE